MRRFFLVLLLTAVPIAAFGQSAAIPASDSVPTYRWRDPAGRLHFSNRRERVPDYATRVELPPVPVIPAPKVARRERASGTALLTPGGRVLPRRRPARECGVADATGLAGAVARHLAGTGQLDDLILLVGGLPVAYPEGAVITVADLGGSARDPVASVEQAALAYPARATCPERPPLTRYPVAARRRAPGRSVCEDYQRAFAEIGVAVGRDQGIARSFRAIARDFAAVAGRGYVAGTGRPGQTIEVQPAGLAPIRRVPAPAMALPPWIVEAHISQTEEIADEAEDFVDELTVALEEIDRAARARGCW